MSKIDKKIWEEKMSVADQVSRAINFKTKEEKMSVADQVSRAINFKTKSEGQSLLKILTNKKAKQICSAKLTLF